MLLHAFIVIYACFQSQDVGIKTIVMLDQQGGKIVSNCLYVIIQPDQEIVSIQIYVC